MGCVRIRLAISLLAVVSGCAAAGAGAAPPAGPVRGLGPALVGTWELVSTRVTRGDRTVLDERPPTVRALKILNGTHYSLVALRNETFARAATGRYRVVGDSYSETIDLASGGVAAGRTYTFRIRVDGDTWTTDGGSGADRFHEVWRRLP
jgi:hypothetical protein